MSYLPQKLRVFPVVYKIKSEIVKSVPKVPSQCGNGPFRTIITKVTLTVDILEDIEVRKLSIKG